jgi:pyruvate/2-oxoglutarate dehydrogenase complex dihydrolipoamide acyltransferase (E2) component
MGSPADWTVAPVPKERQPVLDRLAGASRRFQVHGLLELDVTTAAGRIAVADPRVSWTCYLLASVARAVARHPEVNTRRAGRHLLTFDRVDIAATVERHWQGRTVLDVATLTGADRLTCAMLTDLLHTAKYGPGQPHRLSRPMAQLMRLPGPLRRAAIRGAGTLPTVAAGFGPAVGVTSIGMFADVWGWAVPLAPLSVVVSVGGVAERAVVRDGQVVVRSMLPLTLSFDHAVVDGAPAARFSETLRELVESATALEDVPVAHEP